MKWAFLHVNDSHMGTPRSYRFRPSVNRRWAAIKRQMAAIDAETKFGFHRCDVTDSGIEVTPIFGDDQCEEFDSYGPMGHPSVDQRDYSAARESPPLVPG